MGAGEASTEHRSCTRDSRRRKSITQINLCSCTLLYNIHHSLQVPHSPPSQHTLTPSPLAHSSSPPAHIEVTDDAQITERFGRQEMVTEEEWTELKLTWRQLPKIYLSLSKHRITSECHTHTHTHTLTSSAT